MKKNKFIKNLIILLLIFAISFSCGCNLSIIPKRVKTDYFKQDVFKSKPITNNIHLFTFKGTHYELGEKMGKILNELDVELKKLSDKKKANYLNQLKVIKKYNPGFVDYMKGVASGLGIEYNETGEISFLTNLMNLDFACSAVYVSNKITNDKSNYAARNFDFPGYQGNIQIYKIKDAYDIIGHSFMFCYPYLLDGMNEHGLVVIVNMVVDSTRNAVRYPYPTPSYTGIEAIMAVRIILEKCKNTDEAIKLLSTMPVNFNGPPVHLLIGDASGKSVIVEFDVENKGRSIFIKRDNNIEYQLMTNFPIHTNGYKGNMGYKQGKGKRFDVLREEFENNYNIIISRKFIENTLYKVRMSDDTREMNQGMSAGINTVIRLVYDLNKKEIYITSQEDDFKKEYMIDFK